MGAALSAPVINDVSTSVADPPVYTKSSHPAVLSDRVKEAIEKHYSHIQPLRVSGRDAATVFAATKTAASSLPRASIVHEDAAAGVLELLDVTALARFKDDVAVRVRQSSNDVVVDVRSASRVGKGDLGANAARIQKYLAAVQAELADAPAAATPAAPAAPGKL
ncbi:hypothetical protein ACK3TF_000277 [Chlorella vulgaris]